VPQNDPKLKKILVVDDDEMHNEILEVAFHREGFQVCRAGDGKEALTIATSEKPDLITMDIMMPVMNGSEAIRGLRENGLGAIPVIVISAHEYYTPSKEEGAIVGQPNVVDIIRKPVVIKRLVQRVHEILQTAASGNGA